MKELILCAFVASQIISFISTTPTTNDTFRPPGTVEIVDNFFIDEGEIRNIDWREYLADIKNTEGENSLRYAQAIPDSKVWTQENPLMKPYTSSYLYHPAYDDYPVVGISHQQAINYCKWRTQAVIKMLAKNKIDGPKNFVYRLPTKTEWELCANAGYNKKQSKKATKKMNKYGDNTRIYNMKYEDYNIENLDSQYTPAPTLTYLPNKFGIYNIHGNVAEMVAEPNIAMGGSYRHFYEDIVPTNKALEYDSPQNWLGFRCVCEIIEN